VAEEPDRIKDEIERTRADLTRDVDRLTEKTSPTRVAQRRWTAAREKVMGTPRHAADRSAGVARETTDRVTDAAHSAAGTVREAPQAVARQTQGNPLAAGVIAFGVGLLAASLVPTTELEARTGQQLRDNADGLIDQVREPAQQLKNDVAGTVKDAAGRVKDTATDAARTTADDAKSSAQDAADDARQAVRNAT